MVVHDFLDLASFLRSCSFPVHHVAPEDRHSRFDVLASITEGTTRAAIFGLKGPSTAAHTVNAARAVTSRRKTEGQREQDTRSVGNEHSFPHALILSIQSTGGFIVLITSARKKIRSVCFVRIFLNLPQLQLITFDASACR